ncbi:hypothetical protein L0F51_00105 [Afifella sp. H1R]|uniref:hypothetical protein n=1 Tax=Afifella sp. H1R TaxID=2908841 RepID=UPI001F3A838E|nr:hypothetical protein [Afifella sp. H1R]MCF1502168.1 hypothetical protein [Afifella sp. H1R]
METELAQNLISCAEAYCRERGRKRSTIGRLAAGDWRFFDRLADGSSSFTARKYDEVMTWFSANWPDGLDWPAGVPRPQTSEAAA